MDMCDVTSILKTAGSPHSQWVAHRLGGPGTHVKIPMRQNYQCKIDFLQKLFPVQLECAVEFCFLTLAPDDLITRLFQG